MLLHTIVITDVLITLKKLTNRNVHIILVPRYPCSPYEYNYIGSGVWSKSVCTRAEPPSILAYDHIMPNQSQILSPWILVSFYCHVRVYCIRGADANDSLYNSKSIHYTIDCRTLARAATTHTNSIYVMSP